LRESLGSPIGRDRRSVRPHIWDEAECAPFGQSPDGTLARSFLVLSAQQPSRAATANRLKDICKFRLENGNTGGSLESKTGFRAGERWAGDDLHRLVIAEIDDRYDADRPEPPARWGRSSSPGTAHEEVRQAVVPGPTGTSLREVRSAHSPADLRRRPGKRRGTRHGPDRHETPRVPLRSPRPRR
jgi:hypothetical protein